jgi:hypothetical protein
MWVVNVTLRPFYRRGRKLGALWIGSWVSLKALELVSMFWRRRKPFNSTGILSLDSLVHSVFIIIIIIIITGIELSLGDSSPYTSTDKTSKNKYT